MVNGHFRHTSTAHYGQIMNPPVPAGVDGKASDALLKLDRFSLDGKNPTTVGSLSARGFGRAMSSIGIGGVTTRWCGLRMA
jgi:hypothetical protein